MRTGSRSHPSTELQKRRPESLESEHRSSKSLQVTRIASVARSATYMNMSSSPAPSNSSIYSTTPNVAAISSLDASSCPSRPGAALAEALRLCKERHPT